MQFGNLSGLSFALDGKIYDSHVYSGLKFTGTSAMVMDFDPSNWTSGTTFTGLETGEVWTLNGNAKIYQGLWDATGPSSLLIEEQRTNLLPASSQIGNAYWNEYGLSTVTLNANIAPDGTQTASYITGGYGCNTVTATAGQTYTVSYWVKTIAGSQVRLQLISGTVANTTYNQLISVPIGVWTRISASITVGTGDTYIFTRIMSDASNNPFYAWGAQIEAGSFATSYIPTTTGTVTRSADQASMTGTNFSSWYNQAQGTVYSEHELRSVTDNYAPWGFLNASLNDFDLVTANFRYGTTNINLVTPSSVGNNKFAGSYSTTVNNGTHYASVNGSNIVSVTNNNSSTTISTSMTIGQSFGAFYLNGHIRKLSYYATALPSAVLQSLTS